MTWKNIMATVTTRNTSKEFRLQQHLVLLLVLLNLLPLPLLGSTTTTTSAELGTTTTTTATYTYQMLLLQLLLLLGLQLPQPLLPRLLLQHYLCSAVVLETVVDGGTASHRLLLLFCVARAVPIANQLKIWPSEGLAIRASQIS